MDAAAKNLPSHKTGVRLSAAFGTTSVVAIIIAGIIALNIFYKPPMTHLGTLGGDWSRATAINDSGEVVGESETADKKISAFFWTKETGMIRLGKASWRYSSARSINNEGQVIGGFSDQNNEFRLFLWTQKNGFLEIPNREPKSLLVVDINSAGEILLSGYSESALHHYTWNKKDGAKRIPVAEKGYFRLTAINDTGETFGYYFAPGQNENMPGTPYILDKNGTKRTPTKDELDFFLNKTTRNAAGQILDEIETTPLWYKIWKPTHALLRLPDALAPRIHAVGYPRGGLAMPRFFSEAVIFDSEAARDKYYENKN